MERLEAELETRNLETKRSFQAMEQHFQTVKVEADESAAPAKRKAVDHSGACALWLGALRAAHL